MYLRIYLFAISDIRFWIAAIWHPTTQHFSIACENVKDTIGLRNNKNDNYISVK